MDRAGIGARLRQASTAAMKHWKQNSYRVSGGYGPGLRHPVSCVFVFHDILKAPALGISSPGLAVGSPPNGRQCSARHARGTPVSNAICFPGIHKAPRSMFCGSCCSSTFLTQSLRQHLSTPISSQATSLRTVARLAYHVNQIHADEPRCSRNVICASQTDGSNADTRCGN